MTQTVSKDAAHHAPSIVERAVGILFAFLVLALVAALTILQIEVQPGMQPVLHVLLALMAAAVAATVPGFVNVSYSTGGLALRAAGGGAVMLMVMHFLGEKPLAQIVDPAPDVPKVERQSAEDWRALLQTAPQSLWRADAYCPMTGASGWATDAFSAQNARDMAVVACVAYGGMPDCCASNVRVSR